MSVAVSQAADVASIGSALVGWPVLSATPVHGGGNNRIFLLEGRRDRAALKFYPRQPEDPRDRLGQEFAALSFLTRHGIENVPRPLACDPARGCAAFAWIDGTDPRPVGAADVDALADFFLRLQDLRSRDGAASLPEASASCFSLAMVADQVDARLSRLRAAVTPGTEVADLVSRSLEPAAARAVDRLREGSRTAGLEFAEPLQSRQRALSPSDFGFHNALRGGDGRLAFIDFEYFGWDDPAKAVADVMLHPGMNLPDESAGRYRSRVADGLACGDPGFSTRLDLLYPAMVVLWSLILLNEFLPERWTRRLLAGQKDERAAAQARQLQKARDLLSRNLA